MRPIDEAGRGWDGKEGKNYNRSRSTDTVLDSDGSVVRSWEFSQNLGFWDMNWDHFLDFGKFPKPTKVWEF